MSTANLNGCLNFNKLPNLVTLRSCQKVIFCNVIVLCRFILSLMAAWSYLTRSQIVSYFLIAFNIFSHTKIWSVLENVLSLHHVKLLPWLLLSTESYNPHCSILVAIDSARSISLRVQVLFCLSSSCNKQLRSP